MLNKTLKIEDCPQEVKAALTARGLDIMSEVSIRDAINGWAKARFGDHKAVAEACDHIENMLDQH
jgi:hypothetical protein